MRAYLADIGDVLAGDGLVDGVGVHGHSALDVRTSLPARQDVHQT